MSKQDGKIYPGDGWRIVTHRHEAMNLEELYLEFCFGGETQSRTSVWTAQADNVERVALMRLVTPVMRAFCSAVNAGLSPDLVEVVIQSLKSFIGPLAVVGAKLIDVIDDNQRQLIYQKDDGDFLVVVDDLYVEHWTAEEIATRIPGMWLPMRESDADVEREIAQRDEGAED